MGPWTKAQKKKFMATMAAKKLQASRPTDPAVAEGNPTQEIHIYDDRMRKPIQLTLGALDQKKLIDALVIALVAMNAQINADDDDLKHLHPFQVDEAALAKRKLYEHCSAISKFLTLLQSQFHGVVSNVKDPGSK